MSKSETILKELIEGGMDVARLNFSHGTHGEHGGVIRDIRRLEKELGKKVAILQDLAGPKIRIGLVQEGGVNLQAGGEFTLTNRKVLGNEKEVSVSYASLPEEISTGDTILLADGMIQLKVTGKSTTDILCHVITGGILTSNKGVNLPSRSVRLSSLTEKDRRDLAFGMKQDVDMVALSFVRGPEDIVTLRRLIEESGRTVPIVAKIEKHEALNALQEVVQASDAIMVARGDLGVEIALEKIPAIQKKIIRIANRNGKPVITATQMLRSMVESPRPTRAEASDVVNAIYDGTDAVMLSEETAVGDYPREALGFMNTIACEAEKQFPHERFREEIGTAEGETPWAIARAACMLADSVDAKAIIIPTQSGSTARLVSRLRPRQTVIAISPALSTVRALSMVWGVKAYPAEGGFGTDLPSRSTAIALKEGLAEKGDLVVVTAGSALSSPGTTNLVEVKRLS